ncbi:UNVERIFIED_ORG: type 1 fimbria pilin [Rahnella aquatilis]
MPVIAGILLCSALSGAASAANDTLDLKFTYTVTEGTCTVALPPKVSFGIVSDDSATFDAFNKSWIFIGQSPLAVGLNSCAGSGSDATRTPAINVTGYAVDAATSSSAERKKYLMMPTTSVTGLGMVITKRDEILKNGSTAELMPLAGATTLTIDTGTAGTAPPTGDSTVNFTVALACGTAADCTPAKINSGKDNMTLTFTFGYH